MIAKLFPLAALNDVADLGNADAGLAGDITFQVVGTFTATLSFEATIDGTNWVAVLATNLNSGTAATSTAAAGLFRVDATGFTRFRVRVSAFTSITSCAVYATPTIG
jgi:hypothetical protein